MVDTRVIIITVDISYRRKFTKVLVSLFVFSQYNKVITSVGAAIAFVDAHRSAISLHADNRFEDLFLEDVNLNGSVIFLSVVSLFIIKNLFLFLYLILNLAVIFVSGVGELFYSEHISMIGESHRKHIVLSTFLNQVRHFRHTVEDREMRVYVQMREMFRSICSVERSKCIRFGRLLRLFFFNIGNDFYSGRFYHFRISFLKIFKELLTFFYLFVDDIDTHEFEEHAGGSLHVGGSVMSHIKSLVEQQLMNLSKFRFLKLTSRTSSQLTEISGLLRTSVDDIHTSERIDTFDSQKFASRYIQVETDVMSNNIFHVFQVIQEKIENIVEVFTYVKSVFRTDTMHH